MQYARIQALFYKMTKTNSSSMPNADLNDYTQSAEEDIASIIMQADGRWQYDDTNYTDLPIGTTNLVSSQQDYALSLSQLGVIGVSCLDINGNWRALIPIDPEDIEAARGKVASDRAQFLKTAGFPLFYDKQGSSIFLYPPPDNGVTTTLTAGLKVYFKRGPVVFDFTSGDTSTSPGFNSLYHHLVAIKAAISYCVVNLPELVNGYTAREAKLEAALIKDYSHRDKDDRQILTMKQINHR